MIRLSVVLIVTAIILTCLFACGPDNAHDYGIKRISVLVGNEDMSYPGQALVWDADVNDLFTLGGDYRSDVTLWCDKVWNAGDDSVLNELGLPLESNSIVAKLLEHYQDTSYQIQQSAPACLMSKELIGGLVTVVRREILPEDTVTEVEVPEFQLYCVYDLHRDSLVFVDSLYPLLEGNRGWYRFRQAYLTHDGRYFVYDKHYNTMRFDITNETIDTVAYDCMPVVPINSSDILTCERGKRVFRAYDSTLSVTGEIDEYAWQMFSAYKLRDNVFIVGMEERPAWYRRDEYMWVSIIDFEQKEYIRLFLTRFGQILGVERE